MSERLTLYTTAGCHLCEHAEAMLRHVGAQWDCAEIAEDPSLLTQYGVRIPVIRAPDGRELGWPFDVEALQGFLQVSS